MLELDIWADQFLFFLYGIWTHTIDIYMCVCISHSCTNKLLCHSYLIMVLYLIVKKLFYDVLQGNIEIV